MGNDGGSIPTRRELVKEAAKNPSTAEVKELRQEQQGYFWSTDPISQEPLAQPVVSDSSGKLYNKSTILEYLVEGSRKEDAEKMTQGAVKSLKDVVEVKFEEDPEAPSSTKTQAWKCPVTGSRLGPQTKAVYLVPCGHAFSATAIKEVSGEKCLTCDTVYTSNDIIPILPLSDEDLARLSLSSGERLPSSFGRSSFFSSWICCKGSCTSALWVGSNCGFVGIISWNCLSCSLTFVNVLAHPQMRDWY